MRAPLVCIVLALLLILNLTEPVRADRLYPATIVPVAHSPVELLSCVPWARDWNKTVLLVHAAVGNSLFDLGVSFRNNSAKYVSGLRVLVLTYDSSNSLVASTIFDSKDNPAASGLSVPPGASFSLLGPQSWHVHNTPERDHVSCEITAVRFADGSQWNAPLSAPSGPAR